MKTTCEETCRNYPASMHAPHCPDYGYDDQRDRHESVRVRSCIAKSRKKPFVLRRWQELAIISVFVTVTVLLLITE